jgi:ribosomal protein S18 acetylase RimI-like enzyme
VDEGIAPSIERVYLLTWTVGRSSPTTHQEDEVNALTIRDCRPQDVPAILTLWQQAGATPSVTDTAEDLHRALGTAIVLVAESDGALVGSVIGAFDGWRGNIYRLAVHPRFRRQGIARRLVAEVENRLAQQGGKRISIVVEKDHPWAIGFWEAAGYELNHRLVRFTQNL